MISRRYFGTAVRFLVVGFLVTGGVFLSRAGNPRLVNSVTGPLTWQNGQVPFNTDLGPLGILSNATATQIVLDSFAAWEGVPTATMTSQNLGPILIGGIPVDITLANYSQVLFQLDGQSPIIYDHDGSIMDDLGVGFFAGVSFIEFLTGDLQHYLEGAILLDGRDVAFFGEAGWRGLVAHEQGHHLGLDHTVVNGQAFFFGDPIPGFPSPPASSLETMYPFLIGGADFQAFPHRDDISILSLLYPAPGYPGNFGTIQGTILDADFVNPLRGVNVTARNLNTDPFLDAVSNISGSFQNFVDTSSPLSGFYSVPGLVPGDGHAVGISEINRGGFRAPVLSPLPGPPEFYNGENESNDPDRDDPLDITPVFPPTGPPVDGIDIIINSAAAVRILDDPDVQDPPDDAAVSGFGVPPEIDIERVEARFEDRDNDGGQETLEVQMDVVGPLGAKISVFRYLLDFGEPRKVRSNFLSLKDQREEPGTEGFKTVDITLEVKFTESGPEFSGLPTLGARSHVNTVENRITFVASVEEIFAQATPEQVDAANNFDGTFTILGFSRSRIKNDVDRVPDTNDNERPSIVQETSQFTFFPFPINPTHLASVPNGTLIGVEEGTARTVRIGNIGANSFSDLALSGEGRLFASFGFGNAGAIAEIDLATAAILNLFPSGFDAVPALDFRSDGTLFGIGRNFDDVTGIFADFLITINPDTGAVTTVGGPTEVPFLDGIVFLDDGRLLGTGFIGGGRLAEIDPLTGSTIDLGPVGFFSVVGLEVAGDGSLLGSLGGADGQAGGLVRIDPLTLESEFIGFTGFSPVSGLTRLP